MFAAAVALLLTAPAVGRGGDFPNREIGNNPAPSIAIRAGHMFDSIHGRMLENQIIVIQGERITQVGPAGNLPIPSGAQVIDLSQD